MQLSEPDSEYRYIGSIAQRNAYSIKCCKLYAQAACTVSLAARNPFFR